MTTIATGQEEITSETMNIVERGEREHLKFIAGAGMKGAVYGGKKLYPGDSVFLIPNCKNNPRLIQSGLLRLAGPEAPPPDPAVEVREKYYRDTLGPLGLQIHRLEAEIDRCNMEIEEAQACQAAARKQLIEVTETYKAALAETPKAGKE
jgi:hypothetical protein